MDLASVHPMRKRTARSHLVAIFNLQKPTDSLMETFEGNISGWRWEYLA